MQETIAYGTLLVTLGLVLARPRIGLRLQIGPAAAAAFGVAVLLLAQVVSPRDLVDGFQALWRPFVTIVAIMVSTNVAQRLGVLDYFAKLVRPGAGVSVASSFRAVFIFSAITSAVLNNDAAVLLLTPLIVDLVRRSYPNRPDLVVPFAFAVFSAAGVAPLVISNPMNLIVAEYARIGFNEYAARMIPVSVAGWVTTYAVLRLVFGRHLSAGAEVSGEHRSPALSRAAKQFLLVLGLGLGAYPVLSYAGGPVWIAAAATAAAGLWLCWRHEIASPLRLAAGVSWEILLFLFCIFVIVLGLRNVGLVARIADLYASVSHFAGQITLIAVASAVGSAVLNNHPMAILNALAIRELPQPMPHQVFAALIGGDLGPRLLPMGSLAGLLWLDSLRRQHVHVRLPLFVGVGFAVTVPTLALSVLILLLSNGRAAP